MGSWKPQPSVAMTLVDSRPLAVCLVRAADDLFFNWTTTGWEAPFAAAAHCKPLTRMEPAASLFTNVQSIDLGEILIERSDVAALLLSVDASGNPIAVVDCWTLPSPTPNPVYGGW